MSLTADYQGIKDREKLFDEAKQLRPVFKAIVFVTMFLGMREITAENCQEFFERVWKTEGVLGAFCADSNGPRYITQEDVMQMIGLRTNVFPEWSRRRFERHLARTALNLALDNRRNQEAARGSKPEGVA